ncbi:hypothetical protein GYMLUDRAFT_39308 [Collybiopsis luxurians FD-317 M1]|nr:hypothetical protein GYMLUDRAFT_39308 [Collybiopsis luxurians FD-317 M1]
MKSHSYASSWPRKFVSQSVHPLLKPVCLKPSDPGHSQNAIRVIQLRNQVYTRDA